MYIREWYLLNKVSPAPVDVRHPQGKARVPLTLACIAVVAAALLHPALYRPDGSLLPLAWTLAVAGLALAVIAAAWGTSWQRAGLLLGLALTGQACSLALIQAPVFSYQRYLFWREILRSPSGLFLLGPALQTAVALAAAPKLWQLSRRGHGLLPLLKVAAFVGLLLMLSAARPVFRVRFQVEQISVGGWILLANLANLALLARAIPQDGLKKVSIWASGLPRQRLLPWAVALWVTAVSAGIAAGPFDRVPNVSDAVSYFIQAKYFSAGKLYLPSPPDAAAFAHEKFYNDGRTYWAYGFPGWPAVLALGMLAGAPWLVNPILAGVTILLVHALIRRLYGETLAAVVILLLAASPWFLFTSASFMAHPASLMWMAAALLAIEKERENRNGLWGCLAGASLGVLALTRMFEAVLLGPAILLWCLWPWASRLSWRGLTGMAMAGALVGGLIFPYSYFVTGNPLQPPHNKYIAQLWYAGADRLGFGPDIGNVNWPHLDPGPGHGLYDVLLNAHMNSFMVNVDLFGWAFGSLGFLLLLLFWGGWKRPDNLFWMLAGSISLGHGLYWFSGGPDFGARYWYQILVPAVVLTARGIVELQRRWPEAIGGREASPRIGVFVAAACLISLANYIPWRSLDKYHHFWGIRGEIRRFAAQHDFGNGLVFVRAADDVDYVSAMLLNPPTLDSPGPIFARDLGPESRAAISRRFPDRPVWIVEAPVPLGPYRLVAGGP
jgi:Dolichyl-phosphate-mannose-protein mannosyltransferase